ncbi:hypothetical protein [Streptosporangium lutulentum]|uniref:Uncharacterized protein n=1 Tax=Streptosporangium lutulentum TaxID=1461250 RepID=A0ABT9QBF3_9ACTN|nr:hypothetical protein [Streptosporangium lutulentum]MDP9843681.1 hypothetical protein [Streptosporangium lutulentum]
MTARRRGELTAAAARFTTRFLKTRLNGQSSGRQNTAWNFYDQAPEVRFLLSRQRHVRRPPLRRPPR